MLLSASVETFSVSRMRNFCQCSLQHQFCKQVPTNEEAAFEHSLWVITALNTHIIGSREHHELHIDVITKKTRTDIRTCVGSCILEILPFFWRENHSAYSTGLIYSFIMPPNSQHPCSGLGIAILWLTEAWRTIETKKRCTGLQWIPLYYPVLQFNALDWTALNYTKLYWTELNSKLLKYT